MGVRGCYCQAEDSWRCVWRLAAVLLVMLAA